MSNFDPSHQPLPSWVLMQASTNVQQYSDWESHWTAYIFFFVLEIQVHQSIYILRNQKFVIFELCKNVFFEQKNHHILKGKIQKTCWITFAVSGFIQDAIVIPAHWILAKNDGISSFSIFVLPFQRFKGSKKLPAFIINYWRSTMIWTFFHSCALNWTENFVRPKKT